VKDIITDFKKAFFKDTFEKRYHIIEKQLRRQGVSSYFLHELIKRYTATKKEKILPVNDNFEFTLIEPDGENIRDCKKCETFQKKTVIEGKWHNQGKQILSLSDEINVLKTKIKKRRNWWVFVFTIVFFIVLINVIYYVNNENKKKLRFRINEQESEISVLNDDNNGLNTEISVLQNNINSTKKTISDLQNKINASNADISELRNKIDEIIEKNPIHVTNIFIGNFYKNGDIETKYGNTLYCQNTMYLKPKIIYTIINERMKYETIELNVKLYREGLLQNGVNSPSGYCYNNSILISPSGVEYLKNWGGETKGFWRKGSYKYEIWYNGIMLGYKNFKVY